LVPPRSDPLSGAASIFRHTRGDSVTHGALAAGPRRPVSEETL